MRPTTVYMHSVMLGLSVLVGIFLAMAPPYFWAWPDPATLPPYASRLPLWVQFLGALAPAVIAGIVGYVAYRQWRTAQERLKLDLFDRRWSIYEETKRFLATREAGALQIAAVNRFAAETKGAQFLFDHDTLVFLGGTVRTVMDSGRSREALSVARDPAERAQLTERVKELAEQIDRHVLELDRRMTEYLRIKV